MKNDEIYKVVEHQAKLKCGNLWNDMNDLEHNTAMLKISITMIKDCFGGENGN